jgi:hypothetical protein
MSKSASSNDFVIWGPSVISGDAVLNAVHALYYLPEQYKLVLPPALPEQKEQYQQVCDFIERDNLTGRVHFTDKLVAARRQAIIVTDPEDRRPGSIYGGSSPEALASAILNAYRE